MAKKPVTIEHLDLAIARWKTRLRRAMTAIDKLEKQRKRLVLKQAEAALLIPVHVDRPPPPLTPKEMRQIEAKPPPVAPPVPVTRVIDPVPDLVPDFLRRGVAAQKAVDEVIAEQIKEEQATLKKRKAAGRIATMKAKKARGHQAHAVEREGRSRQMRNGDSPEDPRRHSSPTARPGCRVFSFQKEQT